MIPATLFLVGLILGSLATRALLPRRRTIVREFLPFPVREDYEYPSRDGWARLERAYRDGVETENDGFGGSH